ncbi:AI-2E family transporter [Acaryochloris marina]|uniref:AI-2E family transporter n=1 Tax=Acaryochloris marina TaxID=155978 RepID=UPI001BAF36E2|nr:AI-2E family transporter [Acaryochloris marina]QUY45461.1 AI-2E family transporter [Acaryochloris marina S15]
MQELLQQLPRWLKLLLVMPVVILNLWLVALVLQFCQPLITIFLIANLLAFILDYPVQLLQKWGIQRSYGVLAIIFLAGLGGILFSITLAPNFVEQLTGLSRRLPSWIESGSRQLQTLNTGLAAQNLPIDLSGVADQLNHLLPDEVKLLPNQVLSLVREIADSLIEILLTAVFTLYLLLHGQAFWDGMFARLPVTFGQTVREALRLQFRNYFLGQVAIATLMGITLTTTFFLLKIPYWLVFGIGIGATVLIPFGDFLGIAVVSLLVALKSIWLGGEVLVISALIDQVIDNVIAPRILGKLVGLNPLWVLIALILGAQIGGILGILIAVPLAGSIKVMLDTLLPITATGVAEIEAGVSTSN